MTKDPTPEVMAKLKRVKLVVSDVNGTLTREICLDHEGREMAVFCEKDAPRIAEVIRIGIPFVMISGRNSPAVVARAKELKTTFHWRRELVHPKDAFAWIEDRYGVSREETLYIGDDWGDLWWMTRAAVSATPQDAEKECVDRADIVTRRRGGEGAVSDALVWLLDAKGVYRDIIDGFLDKNP